MWSDSKWFYIVVTVCDVAVGFNLIIQGLHLSESVESQGGRILLLAACGVLAGGAWFAAVLYNTLRRRQIKREERRHVQPPINLD